MKRTQFELPRLRKNRPTVWAYPCGRAALSAFLAGTLWATWATGLPPALLADEQPVLPPPPGSPGAGGPAATVPAEKPKKKAKSSAANKKAPSAPAETERAEPLTPGPATVKQNNVNVRGQAAINSEVVARLKRGEQVEVLQEVTLKRPKTDEPARWAKIAAPTNVAVWVHASFVDPATKTVVPKRLNLRSGPGENYSIIGRLDKGTAVKEIEAKGDWLRIEPPAGTYGFVAAHLLSPQAPPPPVIARVEPPAPPPPALVETAVTPAATPVPPQDVKPEPPPATPPADAAAAPATAPVTATPPAPEPAEEETLVKRVVTREGIVQRSVSIQAPTYFVLENVHNRKVINYLYATNFAIKDFFGQRIVVSGEELLDERWPNTPVINVETLQPVP